MTIKNEFDWGIDYECEREIVEKHAPRGWFFTFLARINALFSRFWQE